MDTTENIQFSAARIRFFRAGVCAKMYPSEKSKVYAFHIRVTRVPSTVLGRWVSSVAQLFNALSPAFSMEEHLTFEGKDRSLPLDSEEHYEVDHTNLHNFFRSFGPMCSLLWLAIHSSKDSLNLYDLTLENFRWIRYRS
jgi:hypothetical protein